MSDSFINNDANIIAAKALGTTVAKALTSISTTRACNDHITSDLKLTDIPKIMRNKLGWIEAARLMEHWFSGKPYSLKRSEKTGKVLASKLSKEKLLIDLSFKWLLKHKRIKSRVDDEISVFQDVREFHSLIGFNKDNILNRLSNGLIIFIDRLDKLNLIDFNNKKIKPGNMNFEKLSAIELDEVSQFNFLRISSRFFDKMLDPLDDVYGALGSFLIKIAVVSFKTYLDKQGFSIININRIGLYIRDTYDFLDEQKLGYWSREGVSKNNFQNKFVEVTNNHFNEYRKCYKEGGDFIVFSDVQYYDVSITIHLNKLDFEEWAARTERKK